MLVVCGEVILTFKEDKVMKFLKPNKQVNLLAISFLVLFSGVSKADVSLKLIEGKKFTDYKMSGQTSSKSLKTLEKELNELFSKLSSDYLLEKQKLEIEITNIDLPGIIHYAYGPNHQDLRIVESPTPYRMYFNFKLVNADGSVNKSGEHKIKDFYDSANKIKRNRSKGVVWYYQEALIKWFKELTE